jgi:antitoxin ParD1/3/4
MAMRHMSRPVGQLHSSRLALPYEGKHDEDYMATLTVSVPDSMKGWIDDQVEEGGFASAGDYLSELVRQDQEKRLEELRRIVDEGLASGISTRTFEERIAEGDRILRSRRTGNARI